MSRRRRDRIRLRAALCRTFNISWGDYGSLTVGERDELIAILEAEQKQQNR